jgi:hypothetical protein
MAEDEARAFFEEVGADVVELSPRDFHRGIDNTQDSARYKQYRNTQYAIRKIAQMLMKSSDVAYWRSLHEQYGDLGGNVRFDRARVRTPWGGPPPEFWSSEDTLAAWEEHQCWDNSYVTKFRLEDYGDLSTPGRQPLRGQPGASAMDEQSSQQQPLTEQQPPPAVEPPAPQRGGGDAAAGGFKTNKAGLPLKRRKPQSTARTDPVKYAVRLAEWESECALVDAALEKRRKAKQIERNRWSKRQKMEQKQAAGDDNAIEQAENCAGIRIGGLEVRMHMSLHNMGYSNQFEPRRGSSTC